MTRTSLRPSGEARFVFIGGLHRSGTTVLAKTLADHPKITGLVDTGVPMDEGQFLQDVYYPTSTKRTLWPIRYLRHLGLDTLGAMGYGGPGRFAFDPRAHLTEESRIASPDVASRILEAWRPYWADAEADRLVEKSPPNLLRTRFLQALFPDAYFVIVVRHPLPVSFSTRQWTRYRPLGLLFEHWLRAHQTFQRDRPRLERVEVVRYETLTERPDARLREILGFLDVEQEVPPHEIKNGVNDRYYARWEEKRSRWSRGWYCDRLERRFGPEIERHGYGLSPPYVRF